MNYRIYYNEQKTDDFDTLASWFQELRKENERLKEANEQQRDDYIRLKLGYDEFKQRNRSLEEENKKLKTERSKTNEVLKIYCGSLVAPIPTIVGMVIDDFFYQKAETECQVKELHKAEKTIDKLNKELVEYADKVEKLEKKLWNPDWCRLIDKLNEIIDEEAPFPSQLKKVYVNAEDEIWYKLDYLARALCMRNVLNDVKNKHIRELENKVNELDVTNRRLKLENEKLIHVQGDNAIEHAAEITDLKQEISALKKELKEHRNKRSPRWPSDVMKIGTLENKVDKLREENNKLKDALEFCQKEASSAREHAHNVEVNAERIRKGLD